MVPRPLQPLHRQLLADARAHAADRHGQAAVIFAQMAAEMITETVLWHWSSEENIDWVVELLAELLPSYNPGNERVRKILERGAGVQLGDQPFWTEFVEHVKRRNRIVHEGAACSFGDVRRSLTAVERLVEYLEPVLARRWHHEFE